MLIELSYDEWEEKFKPIQNPLTEGGSYDNCMVETYGDEWEYVRTKDPKNVWNLVDGEGPHLCIINGFHYVNRLGYIVTEEQWEDGASYEVND